MQKKKLSFSSLFIILSVFIIFSSLALINKNLKMKKEIEFYKQTESEIAKNKIISNKIKCEQDIEGKHLNINLLEKLDAIKNQRINVLGSNFVVLFIFSTDDCISCLKFEIPIWNKFAISYHNKFVKVIGIVDTLKSQNIKLMATVMKIKFPIFHLNDLENWRYNNKIISTPAILLVSGENFNVIYSFFPDTRKKSSDGFLKKVESILETYSISAKYNLDFSKK